MPAICQVCISPGITNTFSTDVQGCSLHHASMFGRTTTFQDMAMTDAQATSLVTFHVPDLQISETR